MKASAFEYVRPDSLESGLQRLAEGGMSTKIMGGSQSLGPMLNLRLARPKVVIDVSLLPEMRAVTLHGKSIRIGGAVTHAELEDGIFPLLEGTILQSVAGTIAYRAIRNRGTIAGSLAHADPAADWVVLMTALAADLELQSTTGKRMVPMDRFMLGAYTTEVGDGELIAAIHVPRLGPDARCGYEKFCRKTGEFAEASCAAVFDPDRHFARIVIGALDGAPQPLPKLAIQVAASGLLPDNAEIDQAVAESAPMKDAIDRRIMTAAVRRCLQQVLRTGAAR